MHHGIIVADVLEIELQKHWTVCRQNKSKSEKDSLTMAFEFQTVSLTMTWYSWRSLRCIARETLDGV